MVQLPAELVAVIDQRAAREGVSRSKLIREALTAFIAADVEIARAYDEGYARLPFGTADEWGDLEAFHAALERERTGRRAR